MMIEITPVPKPRQTQQDKWKVGHRARPAVARYRDYCDQLRLQMPGYELGMSLNIRFYIPMPKSWSQKKREAMRGTYHDQKPDIDNLAKAFMDAFKAEDKRVAVLHAEKYWDTEGSIEIL